MMVYYSTSGILKPLTFAKIGKRGTSQRIFIILVSPKNRGLDLIPVDKQLAFLNEPLRVIVTLKH